MKKYLSALSNATQDLAKFMTYDLRERAVRDGWEPEVARGITVSIDGDKITHSLGDVHKNRAFDHEYGTETSRPKATIRRYLNNAEHVNAAAYALFKKHLKESK